MVLLPVFGIRVRVSYAFKSGRNTARATDTLDNRRWLIRRSIHCKLELGISTYSLSVELRERTASDDIMNSFVEIQEPSICSIRLAGST